MSAQAREKWEIERMEIFREENLEAFYKKKLKLLSFNDVKGWKEL